MYIKPCTPPSSPSQSRQPDPSSKETGLKDTDPISVNQPVLKAALWMPDVYRYKQAGILYLQYCTTPVLQEGPPISQQKFQQPALQLSLSTRYDPVPPQLGTLPPPPAVLSVQSPIVVPHESQEPSLVNCFSSELSQLQSKRPSPR